ncbi:MAG TPA: branched-chain amino acid ABC transporter ATP-binding protein/permease [Paracoccus sp. (in: a-proteobacteria)]|uniref:branched-chain amino acid ABC transporter ATP-binding protein/permease n=1 Tax=Paracoccus sp. TaxID=267 RepID=UPI002C2239EF|nr:branched-chain amino acid ABC transporter ATP-binding protein/permease [Paracoccus sp. (in: a-proteobacteria)]HWL55567.1 branched-chain amino acid ABC transporter ATP-binding protein/permease [Paracoccus sp. (in: a-proteobacteria)]
MTRNLLIHPLLVAIVAAAALPALMNAIGLTTTSAAEVVIYALACMGLNLLAGYTGLVSFGHGAWFGLGAYIAALVALALPGHAFVLPLLAAIALTGVVSAGFGWLMLRRRGVYFSLMTLALSALGFTVAFRWTAVTGGENGLGGIERPVLLGIDLNDSMSFYIAIVLLSLVVVALLWRLVNSPLGHVLEAIRENETRATALGYRTRRYKLAAFVISASIAALAGALLLYKNRMTSAEPMSIIFSGELLAMTVIGGMRGFLGPALGALFYILFREYLSIYTENWLFWFGLVFMGFVLFARDGLIGIGRQIAARLFPGPDLAAAMADRKVEVLPLPEMLRAQGDPAGSVLKATDIVKSFGAFKAVDGVSIDVRDRSLHALIGPNGAGKTTAFNLLTGMLTPNSGSVTLAGHQVAGLPADRIAEMGMGRSFQITSLFPDLSVQENVRLALQAGDPARMNPWLRADRIERINNKARQILAWVGLAGMEGAKAGSLSYGGQRLLDLGLALANHPRVLLADEPLAGLSVAERERVGNLIKQVSADIPVLLVEHDIDRVFSLADHVTVMNEGKVLLDGTVADARASDKVREIYIGSGTAEVAASAHPGVIGETICMLDNVNVHYGKSHILHDVGFDIRKGEILALLGRNGAGKSTLLKSMIGIAPVSSGSIRLENHELAGLDPATIARAGIGYVPQGRGLFAGMTVRENLELGRLKRRTGSGSHWSDEQILEFFPRLGERMETEADRLSGGEQQMAAVARALSGDTRVLLLDEPFEGLAPAVVEQLFHSFDKLREHLSIVIVDHNLDLALALSDRTVALEMGRVFHDGPSRALATDIELRRKVLWL